MEFGLVWFSGEFKPILVSLILFVGFLPPRPVQTY